jgi:hypothetical protein
MSYPLSILIIFLQATTHAIFAGGLFEKELTEINHYDLLFYSLDSSPRIH